MKNTLLFSFALFTWCTFAQTTDSRSIVKPSDVEVILDASITNNLEVFKDKDDAVVYIYRLSHMLGAWVKLQVQIDDKPVVDLGQREYTVAHINSAEKGHLIALPNLLVNLDDIKPNRYYFISMKGGIESGVGYLDEAAINEINTCISPKPDSKSNANIKLKHEGKVDKVQTIALLATMIGKIQQTGFPIGDAAVFNKKTNSIAEQIMDEQKLKIDRYREVVASSLKRNFNCKVLYSDSLHISDGFTKIKKFDFKQALKLESAKYPVIVAADGDINPFMFIKGAVIKYFSYSPNYKVMISNIAKELNSDLIAVSYSTLNVYAVTRPLVGIGYLRLDSYLYLFNRDGELMSEAHTWSVPSAISGSQITEYKLQLDYLPRTLEPMMKKLVLNYKK